MQQYRLAGLARVLFVIRNVNEFVAAFSERSLKIQPHEGGDGSGELPRLRRYWIRCEAGGH